MLLQQAMFSEPLKIPVPHDDFYQYRVKNTFIDAFEEEDEDEAFDIAMKSCPAGIWKFSKSTPVGLQQPVKVSLDPGSPVAASHGETEMSPPGFGLSAAEVSRSQLPPGLSHGLGVPSAPQVKTPKQQSKPQVKLGQPSVVPMVSWSGSAASVSPYGTSPAAAGSASAAEQESVMMRAPSFSSGAALHEAGKCEPCAWYWKPSGCRNAQECKRCHLCPEGALKNRKKAKVAMMRAMATSEDTPYESQGAVEASPQFMAEDSALSMMRMCHAPAPVVAVEQARARPVSEVQPEPQGVPAAQQTPVAQGVLGGPGELNIGSRPHITGECEPCAWFWRPGGCSHGMECRRCHLCPEGEVKRRKKMKLAMLRKSREDAAGGPDAEGELEDSCL